MDLEYTHATPYRCCGLGIATVQDPCSLDYKPGMLGKETGQTDSGLY